MAIMAAAMLVFAALSLYEAVTSKGFLEADSCTHYMYARFAFAHPFYFTNVWGRPVCTGLYAIPALLAGRLGARAASLCVAIALAWVCRAIARGQNWRWPGLALVFTLAQPLVFLHSFSTLTELPFALLLGLGFLAYQRRQFWWMAIIIGFTPLSRPEGFGLLLLASAALLCHRKWLPILILFLPLVGWDLVGWWVGGSAGPWWHWLIANWPYAAKSLYKPGPIWHFVALLPAIVSPLIFPAMLLGIGLCLRPAVLRSFFRDHRQRCEALIALLPLSVLIGHSFLYWRGLMASDGEARYMLTVAAFWALLSARGWEWVFTSLRWSNVWPWAGIVALLPLLANHVYGVLPLKMQPDWVRAQQIADWYRDSNLHKKYPYIAAAHPGIFYSMDICPADHHHTRDWQKATLDAVPPGTLVVWDGCYGIYNADPTRSITRAELLKDGWTPIKTPWTGHPAGQYPWQLFVSRPLKP